MYNEKVFYGSYFLNYLYFRLFYRKIAVCWLHTLPLLYLVGKTNFNRILWYMYISSGRSKNVEIYLTTASVEKQVIVHTLYRLPDDLCRHYATCLTLATKRAL